MIAAPAAADSTESPLLAHVIPGGAAWSVAIRAGRSVRLSALGDRSNATVLMFGADRVDRLNMPDTLKAQHTARVRAPMVLMSDLGSGLATVMASSLDWHDALCGHSLDAHVPGSTSYQADRNEWRRSARHGLLAELRKRGLAETDLHGCVNFFSKAAIDEQSGLTFVPEHASPGDWVELRTEQEILLIVSTAPHPLDHEWRPTGVAVDITAADPSEPVIPDGLVAEESRRALVASRAVLV